ncbi:MAG: DNA repair exonuclease, partial [Lachnospiraceae bacterium]|nr:DNA repair exonuclease [Lachnospiraceae bacterium]
DAIEEAIRGVLEDAREQDLVQVVLTGRKDMETGVDTERLTQSFAEEYYYFRVQDKTSIRIDYDAFAADRSLKGEFVRLMQQEDMPEEERARIIDLGLRAILNEEVIY